MARRGRRGAPVAGVLRRTHGNVRAFRGFHRDDRRTRRRFVGHCVVGVFQPGASLRALGCSRTDDRRADRDLVRPPRIDRVGHDADGVLLLRHPRAEPRLCRLGVGRSSSRGRTSARGNGRNNSPRLRWMDTPANRGPERQWLGGIRLALVRDIRATAPRPHR